MATTSNTRYCANGNQCVLYEPVDGKPAKLNSLNTDEICGACRERERDAQLESAQRGSHADSPTPRRREGRTRSRTGSEGKEAEILSSSATAEIYNLKAELVISLYARRGPFWEMVKDARERWDISPKVTVPPSTLDLIDDDGFPLHSSNPFFPEDCPDPYILYWRAEVREIQKRVVPEKYLDHWLAPDWFRFFAACVLYDPPDTELPAFAEVLGPEPEALLDSRAPDDLPNEDVRMLKPPVKSRLELTESEDKTWDRVMYGLGELFRSSGVDPKALLAALEQAVPSFSDGYHRMVERDSSPRYIEVDERTIKDDVVNAFRMMRALQGRRATKGRRERDRLTAVQCAILKDRHRWTYRRIAERFGLGSKDAAKGHVELGREILEQD